MNIRRALLLVVCLATPALLFYFSLPPRPAITPFTPITPVMAAQTTGPALSGRITNQAGEPVENVAVIIMVNDKSVNETATIYSGYNGEYYFFAHNLPTALRGPGGAPATPFSFSHMRLEHPSLASTEIVLRLDPPVSADGTQTRDFVLSAGGHVFGRVVSPGGVGWSNMHLHIRALNIDEQNAVGAHVVTNDNGYFSTDFALPAGPYAVYWNNNSAEPTRLAQFTLGPEMLTRTTITMSLSLDLLCESERMPIPTTCSETCGIEE